VNVLAGILIGWVNDAWAARLLAPFVWALVWCGRAWTLSLDDKYVAACAADHLEPPRFGLTDRNAFYVIEYLTAATNSLVFSVLAGAIRSWTR